MADDQPAQSFLESRRRLLEDAAARVEAMKEKGIAWPTSADDITPDHPFAKAIGLDKAKRIFRAPKPPKPKRVGPTPLQRQWAERREQVAQRLAEGATLPQIAREMSVTPSRIWQIKKALDL